MPPKPMVNRSKRGPFDEISTPVDAIDPLVPYLLNALDPVDLVQPTIWEPAPGEYALATYLQHGHGFDVVVTTNSFYMMEWPVECDVLVTNPPFSKKIQWLSKCHVHNKPFALLLPITTLGVRRAHPYLEGIEIILLKRRIDFTGKGRPWFSVAWFTYGFNLGKQLNFPGS